jgi:hypothetical protein
LLGFGTSPALSAGSFTSSALVEMALIVSGELIRKIGERRATGSGLILDPEQARRDLEPFSRQGGGMLRDALDEAEIDSSRGLGAEPQVMVRCLGCQALNEEGLPAVAVLGSETVVSMHLTAN